MANTEQKPKTVVLVGYDFKHMDARYTAQGGDVQIIRAQPGQSLQEALKAIKPPANVVLAAHGWGDGTFQWKEDEWISYDDLFAALPRIGIASLSVLNCYGGTAQAETFLKKAPPGTLVVSLIGARNPSLTLDSIKFAEETAGVTDPVDLFLEVLDNFDPEQYHRTEECLSVKDGEDYNSDPEQALPHIIGIGGDPPQRIDLKEEVRKLAAKGAALAGDAAWTRAIERVQARFDLPGWKLRSPQTPDCKTGRYTGSKSEERQLDDSIAALAAKIARGTPPENVEEQRRACALAAVHMQESGDLARRQQGSTANNLLRNLENAHWTAVMDGKDNSGKDGHISFDELQAKLRQYHITLHDVDADHDAAITANEIARVLNAMTVKQNR